MCAQNALALLVQLLPAPVRRIAHAERLQPEDPDIPSTVGASGWAQQVLSYRIAAAVTPRPSDIDPVDLGACMG
jgi:hypothetical protein